MVVSPVVADPADPPVLQIEVRNVAGENLPFMRYSVVCFARFYLSVSMSSPRGERLAPAWPQDCPGAKGELGAGASEKVEVSLKELFPQLRWVPGRYGLDIFWDTRALAVSADAKFVHPARSLSINQPEFHIARRLAMVRVEKGKTVTLPDGAKLTFAGNSHKMVESGGPASPLVVAGRFAPPGAKASDFQRSVFMRDSRVFQVDGYRFALVAQEYDAWLELAYFGKP